MKKLKNIFLMVGICGFLFSAPVIEAAKADSFFDIFYRITLSPDGGAPRVTATLPDGSDVVLRSKGTVKFFNETKGFGFIATVEQEIGNNDTLEISATCNSERCFITDVENKGPAFRGHVTVLK